MESITRPRAAIVVTTASTAAKLTTATFARVLSSDHLRFAICRSYEPCGSLVRGGAGCCGLPSQPSGATSVWV